MEGGKRKGRPGEGDPEPAAQPVDQPAERPEDAQPKRKGGRKAGLPKVRKVKMTVSFDEDLATRLTVTASCMRVDVCDLLDRLIRPQLKGFSAPTIPDGVKALFPAAAAPAS